VSLFIASQSIHPHTKVSRLLLLALGQRRDVPRLL
jgi:hypothetical protein